MHLVTNTVATNYNTYNYMSSKKLNTFGSEDKFDIQNKS